MDRWVGRVALVTGANSGIGAEISKALIKHGLKVIGADINKEYMETFPDQAEKSGSFSPYICDITKEDQVEEMFEYIEKEFGHIDICVNNAGVAVLKSLLDGTPEIWRKQMDINVIAMCHCSKLAIHLMLKKKNEDGQIINIASMASHIDHALKDLHFYTSTKRAVKYLTQSTRNELVERKSKIRVAMISPGVVFTNIFKNTELQNVFGPEETLHPTDIADATVYILSTPPRVQIHDIILGLSGRVA